MSVDPAPRSTWRCPHCGTIQPAATRCWACRRSPMTCRTCRYFRKAVAAEMGFCALDRTRAAISGDEVRACWQGDPEMVASLPSMLVPMVPAVDDPDGPGAVEVAGGEEPTDVRGSAAYRVRIEAPRGVPEGSNAPVVPGSPAATDPAGGGAGMGAGGNVDSQSVAWGRGADDPGAAAQAALLPDDAAGPEGSADPWLGRLVEAPRIGPARRLVSAADERRVREREIARSGGGLPAPPEL